MEGTKQLKRVAEFLAAQAEERIVSELFETMTPAKKTSLVKHLESVLRGRITEHAENYLDSHMRTAIHDAIDQCVVELMGRAPQTGPTETFRARVFVVAQARFAVWVETPRGIEAIDKAVAQYAPDVLRAIVKQIVNEKLAR